ncbi:MAG: HAD-IIA family hydrolase [Clostridiales bacterium]|nr:HAD-IIA family hydrolase [Clostridiales bacterium]
MMLYNNINKSEFECKCNASNIDPKVFLKGKKLFVLDMDGTFYLGEQLLPGALDFTRKATECGINFLFFTNNSSKSGEVYREKLMKMGLPAEKAVVMTSGDVTIDFIKENYPDSKVLLVGTPPLEESFKKAGIRLFFPEINYHHYKQNVIIQNISNHDIIHQDRLHEDIPPNLIVVIGFDTTLTYEKISMTCRYIREGAPFIATHMDLNCPTEDGFIPDCGSMCAMITASTGVKPRHLGKPFPETVLAIERFTGVSAHEMVFVGDRLYTDIATGRNNGAGSILVLTGETTEEDLRVSVIKPDLVYPSLGNIIHDL